VPSRQRASTDLRRVCVIKVYTGGHVVSFVCTLPTLGPGGLVPLEHSNRDETADDKKSYLPRDIEWNNLGEACADAGVGVTMFMAPAKFLDIASIGMHFKLPQNHVSESKSFTASSGIVSSLSGGDIFYHWGFKPLRDGPIMESQLRRVVARTTGYNCTLRVRASSGWVFVTFSVSLLI
jgi:protein transport protein SEC24